MRSILDSFKLDGKIALITGSSRGIGKSMAKALGEVGATVIVHGSTESNVTKTVSEFDAMGIKCFPAVFNVSNDKDVDAGISKIEKEVGDIDILFNNAGAIQRTPMLDVANDDFRNIIDIDLIAPFVVAKRVVPNMIKNGGGKIINICSMMSEVSRNSVASYAAAKGGLKMLTKNMCAEWARHNIQVNGLGPGFLQTDLTKDIAKDGHPFNDLIMTRTPAGCWGKPEDLDGAALLLSSQAGDFINGHILYVDGGVLANFGYVKGENEV